MSVVPVKLGRALAGRAPDSVSRDAPGRSSIAQR